MKKLIIITAVVCIAGIGFVTFAPNLIRKYERNQLIESAVKHCTGIAVERTSGIEPEKTAEVYNRIYNACMDDNRAAWADIDRLDAKRNN